MSHGSINFSISTGMFLSHITIAMSTFPLRQWSFRWWKEGLPEEEGTYLKIRFRFKPLTQTYWMRAATTMTVTMTTMITMRLETDFTISMTDNHYDNDNDRQWQSAMFTSSSSFARWLGTGSADITLVATTAHCNRIMIMMMVLMTMMMTMLEKMMMMPTLMVTMPAIRKGLQEREEGRGEQLKLAPSEQPWNKYYLKWTTLKKISFKVNNLDKNHYQVNNLERNII